MSRTFFRLLIAAFVSGTWLLGQQPDYTLKVDVPFGRSLNREKALSPEPFLAYGLNGDPLTKHQGAPLRLIVPGWYGVANVKWLAQIHVQQDPYVGKYQGVHSSGERVIIDGFCASACTIVLGTVPHDRICVTSRARLGFHAAWDPDSSGRKITNLQATQSLYLMSALPKLSKIWTS